MKVYIMSATEKYYGNMFIAAETEEQARGLTNKGKGVFSDDRIVVEEPMLSANVDTPRIIADLMFVRQ
jgi:hypothetical protein